MNQLVRLIKYNNHLLIAVIVAALVHLVLLSDLQFFRNFIPTLQRPTAYLLVWDNFDGLQCPPVLSPSR